MTRTYTRPGASWIVTGGVLALVGLAIILWPERGLTPHPLPFPPSTSTRPIAAYAVLGYPFLALGLLLALAGGMRALTRGGRSADQGPTERRADVREPGAQECRG